MAVVSPEVVTAYHSFIASNPDRKPRTEAERAALFQEIQSRIQGSSQTLSPSLPALQTQQAVREFQVRSPQPRSSMQDRLALYPGANGDPYLGRNRLGSMRNTHELQTIKSPAFPEIVDGRLDQSPGYIRQVVAHSLLPDTTASDKKANLAWLQQQIQRPDITDVERNRFQKGIKSAQGSIDHLVQGNVAKMLNRQRYAGFQDPDRLRGNATFLEKFIETDANPGDMSVATGAAYDELGGVRSRLFNLENRFGEGVTREFLSSIDRDKIAGHLGLTQMKMLGLSPAESFDLGLREKPMREMMRDDYEYGFRPGLPQYHDKTRLHHRESLDDVMGAVYDTQKYSPGIKDIFTPRSYTQAEQQKFTAAGKPITVTASDGATFADVIRQGNQGLSDRYNESLRLMDIGNRDMPTSEQMIQNDLSRQELIGEFEGGRRAAPYATTYLSPTFKNSDLVEDLVDDTYAYAPVKRESATTKAYRALSQQGYSNPIAEVESALKYQVLPYSGTTTPYGARAKNTYIPQSEGGNYPAPGGTFRSGYGETFQNPQSLLAQRIPMQPNFAEQLARSTNPIGDIARSEARLPRVTEYVQLKGQDLRSEPSIRYYQDAKAGQSLAKEQFAQEFPQVVAKAKETRLPVTTLMDNLYTNVLRDSVAATTDSEIIPFKQISPQEQQALYKQSHVLDGLVKAEQIRDDVRSMVKPGEYGLTPVEDPVSPNTTLRAIAGQAYGQNLDAQRLEMGRDFTPTSQLQEDPRVAALREKAIARQQEIDAGNELMAVRQQRIAERTGPARVSQSPLPQRQVVVEHPVNDRFARLVASQGGNPDLADVLERAGRGMVLNEVGREIPQSINRRTYLRTGLRPR